MSDTPGGEDRKPRWRGERRPETPGGDAAGGRGTGGWRGDAAGREGAPRAEGTRGGWRGEGTRSQGERSEGPRSWRGEAARAEVARDAAGRSWRGAGARAEPAQDAPARAEPARGRGWREEGARAKDAPAERPSRERPSRERPSRERSWRERPSREGTREGTREERGREAGGARKTPRKVSARSLENVALFYLERYAATVSQLRRVLLRRVDRSLKVHGGDRAEAVGWVDALVEKLVRNGLVNDTAYAGMKAHSLRASGRSARVIAQKLRMKGVPAPLVQQKLAEATAELSEEDAARIWARKKRLGPYRREPHTRQESRQKDLAALARAGFSFGVAKKVIDSEPE